MDMDIDMTCGEKTCPKMTLWIPEWLFISYKNLLNHAMKGYPGLFRGIFINACSSRTYIYQSICPAKELCFKGNNWGKKKYLQCTLHSFNGFTKHQLEWLNQTTALKMWRLISNDLVKLQVQTIINFILKKLQSFKINWFSLATSTLLCTSFETVSF